MRCASEIGVLPVVAPLLRLITLPTSKMTAFVERNRQ